jgi:hypothetical protein
MEMTLTTTNEQDHPKMTCQTGTITEEEDQEIMITTTPTAR